MTTFILFLLVPRLQSERDYSNQSRPSVCPSVRPCVRPAYCRRTVHKIFLKFCDKLYFHILFCTVKIFFGQNPRCVPRGRKGVKNAPQKPQIVQNDTFCLIISYAFIRFSETLPKRGDNCYEPQPTLQLSKVGYVMNVQVVPPQPTLLKVLQTRRPSVRLKADH